MLGETPVKPRSWSTGGHSDASKWHSQPSGDPEICVTREQDIAPNFSVAFSQVAIEIRGWLAWEFVKDFVSCSTCRVARSISSGSTAEAGAPLGHAGSCGCGVDENPASTSAKASPSLANSSPVATLGKESPFCKVSASSKALHCTGGAAGSGIVNAGCRRSLKLLPCADGRLLKRTSPSWSSGSRMLSWDLRLGGRSRVLRLLR